MKYIILFIFIGLLTSCIKEIDGPMNIASSSFDKIEIDMVDPSSSFYKKVYYNVSSKSIVKSSLSTDWFIAFSSDPSSSLQKVIMNGAYNANCNGFTNSDTNFFDVKNLKIFDNRTLYYANFYDTFAHLFESNFEGLNSKNYVYYLHFNDRGYFKFQILNYTNASVTFRYANLDNTNIHEITLPLQATQNFTYFSLNTHQVADIEPVDKNSWDIEFTRFTTFITDFGQPQMYGVNGALFNPAKTIKTAVFDNEKIENIDLLKASTASYSNSLKTIGYTWKTYSTAGPDGFFTIAPKVYVLKNVDKTYVLQFVEYTKLINNVQVSGYPTFLQKSL